MIQGNNNCHVQGYTKELVTPYHLYLKRLYFHTASVVALSHFYFSLYLKQRSFKPNAPILSGSLIMSTHIHYIQPELQHYLNQINEPELPILTQIRQQTNQISRLAKMAIAPQQVALLTWLAKLINVRQYLEIGVFTGYSSTAMALALPEEAKLTCCDINVTFTDIARQHWQQAQIAHKIELHLQPALITLDELLANGQADSYDMALIDADKPPTPQYYERCLKLVRKGGIIAIDNLLLGGRILNQTTHHSPPSHTILQEFNAHLPHDKRIIPITLPLGDGLTLLMKK